MKSKRWTSVAVALASVVVLALASGARADESGLGSRAEVSVLGGIQALNRNDTAFPDRFINSTAAAAVTYHLSRILAVEGEFTWMIPVSQSVTLGSGTSQDLKTPNILAYQANLRASWPLSNSAWTPYVAAGAGAITFLSNTDADRLPALNESQTAFAINFGTGVNYGVTSSWGVRADFREFAAFPSTDAVGLSSGGVADPIWMARGTLGLAYRF
jgi:opacity protein-like surface antigen